MTERKELLLIENKNDSISTINRLKNQTFFDGNNQNYIKIINLEPKENEEIKVNDKEYSNTLQNNFDLKQLKNSTPKREIFNDITLINLQDSKNENTIKPKKHSFSNIFELKDDKNTNHNHNSILLSKFKRNPFLRNLTDKIVFNGKIVINKLKFIL